MHLPMIRRLFAPVAALLLAAAPGFAQRIDPELTRTFSSLPAGRTAEVIVTFDGNSAPAVADLDALTAVGIKGGITFRSLPMAAVLATSEQVQALSGNSRVRSVFLNKRLTYYNYDARHLTGVERLRADRAMTTRNGGLPVSGRRIGIVINDSGVDGTHPDLQYGKNLVQNVQAPVSSELLAVTGFQLAVALENQVNTDLGSGHGTHVAGTVGGTGQASQGKHSGVANGANLIGYGSGAVLYILNALGGFDWSIANQGRYGIRVINNSWGSSGDFDPDDPINVASRLANERNIVVAFAAGNSGSAPDTHNPYAKAPWVISVAAGTKQSTLADFSSRGRPGGPRTVTSQSGEVITWLDEPSITAPGVDIYSAYAPTGVLGALGPDTSNPFYTVMEGTSMASPHVAGIAGLMLEANPLLTPDQVKQIIRETATKMPGLEGFEVGAGYVNAYAAVQKAFDLATPFGKTLTVPTVPATVRNDVLYDKTFDYSPASLPGAYKHSFTVAPGASLLEAKIEFKGLVVPAYGTLSNPLLFDVYDPNGNRYIAFDLFFADNGTTRLVIVVNDPIPGTWTAEVKALTPLGNESGNFATFPDRVHETEILTFVTPPHVADIQGHAAKGAIELALVNGFLGLCSNSSFCPNKELRRADLARGFTQFGSIRQNLPLGGASTFGDVSAAEKPFVEAVAARGAATRDREHRYGGVMEGTGGSFDPNGKVQRAGLAKMLVRGIGGDAAAIAHTGDVTYTYNGQTYVIADQDQIPAGSRGYVHAAINSNMMNVYAAVEQGPYDLTPKLKFYFKPASTVTRADAAVAISRYYAQFFK
jgi:serine protease AprX